MAGAEVVPATGMVEIDVSSESQASSPSSGLEWRNLSFKVGQKDILKGVSGSSSKYTAIMGPSGAGKSTLMNIIAGRVRSKGAIQVAGDVFFQGKKVDPVAFSKEIAYVMQEDALFATQTPREAFHFSAALRLGSEVTEEQRSEKVEALLKELALEKCSDTMIGNVMIKGLSGGEKKRTAIGIELISNPRILFLDEPTSGLDSFAAFKVVNILAKLSEAGRTVLCTIHQPSSEVFSVFEDTLLIWDGRLAFHDKRARMVKYFAGLGHACPAHYNPADFVMFLMQEQPEEEMARICDGWAEDHKKEFATVGSGCESKPRSASADRPNGQSFCTQMSWLAQRELRQLVRNKAAIFAQFGTTAFLYIVIGCIFYGAADYSGLVSSPSVGGEIFGSTQKHFGVITFIATGAMFGLAQPIMLAFPMERPIFIREYASGVYGVVPYFLSKLMVEVPQCISVCAFIYLISYWIVGLQGNFLLLTLVTALFGLVASSVSLLIGSLVANVEVGVQLTPLLFVPQLLFSGFYIPITEIPEWMRWAQYLCSLKYALNLLLIIEFEELPTSWPKTLDSSLYYSAVYGCDNVTSSACAAGSTPLETALLPKVDVVVADAWVYVAVLLAIFTIFRVAALAALTARSRN